MVVFTRFYAFRKPLILCATTGFLLKRLTDEDDIDKDNIKSTIAQADLICQGFKEKQGIPGNNFKDIDF